MVSSGSNPSASTMTMVGVLQFFEKYNNLQSKPCPTFIIGGHPTVLPQRSLVETKSDFRIGEGYQAVEGLFNHFENGIPLSTIQGIGYFDGDSYVSGIPELLDLQHYQ